MITKRFFAFLIDYLITLPISVIFTTFFFIKIGMCDDMGLSLFITVFFYINPLLIFNIPSEAILKILFSICFTLITTYCGYCLLMEFCLGRTIGQKIQNVVYLNRQKEPLSRKQMVVRNVLKYICLILGFIGILSVPLSTKRKPLYDILLNVDIIE